MSKIHLKGHLSPDGEIELKTPKVGVMGLVAGGIAALAVAVLMGAAESAGSFLFYKWQEKRQQANENEERSQQ